MAYEFILYEVTEDVARITLNRPDRMNSLNKGMRYELLDALTRAPDEARCLLLTGAGRGFCAGQDLADRQKLGDVDLERSLREEYAPLLKLIREAPIPTISAVNGAAAGAGANLALAADLVIAARSAQFIQAFARIGLIPDAGGTWALPRRVGLARAMGLSLLAEPLTAEKAADWGLIWEAVEDDRFAARVAEVALKLAQGPTRAYRAMKDAYRASAGNGFEEQIALEARLQGELGRSRDFSEGVLAFLEKRPAKFEGR